MYRFLVCVCVFFCCWSIHGNYLYVLNLRASTNPKLASNAIACKNKHKILTSGVIINERTYGLDRATQKLAVLPPCHCRRWPWSCSLTGQLVSEIAQSNAIVKYVAKSKRTKRQADNVLNNRNKEMTTWKIKKLNTDGSDQAQVELTFSRLKWADGCSVCAPPTVSLN